MNLRNIPIQRKLTTIIMLTTSAVLLLTCVAFLTYEFVSFRKTLVQEMRTISAVIAANSIAAVAFADETAASEILSTLRAEKNVINAVLFDVNGNLLAHYPSDMEKSRHPPVPSFAGYRFHAGSAVMVEPVERADTRIGTLVLTWDLQDFYDRLQLYAVIVILVFAVSVVMAFFISRWLQQSISQPILELAKTAKAISKKNDYSVRANKFGRDELGTLTDAFNLMLSQIDARDAELLASRERLKLALSASQTGTWDWNLITQRMNWDEFTERLFGLERGKFQGGPDQMIKLFHSQDRQSVSKAVAATVQHQKSFRAEGRVTWPDGSEHHLALRGTTVPESLNSTVRVTGVCLDITDRKRAEERIRQMNAGLEERVLSRTAELTASHQELEAFTYSVSHDLRAPLRHIIAFAEILKEEIGPSLNNEAGDYLHRIHRGAKSMSQLVDDLLNLARIGRQGLNLQKIDMADLVDEIIIDFQPEIKSRKIKWDIQPLPEMFADPGLLRQVFANLISNAIKYTRPKTDAEIQIGCENRNGDIVIFVRDNGVGFNMKFADKLFGVFQRLHSSEAFEGTGVGLALVERIVHKHSGRVWAHSEEGKGSTFYFSLPAANEISEKISASA